MSKAPQDGHLRKQINWFVTVVITESDYCVTGDLLHASYLSWSELALALVTPEPENNNR